MYDIERRSMFYQRDRYTERGPAVRAFNVRIKSREVSQ